MNLNGHAVITQSIIPGDSIENGMKKIKMFGSRVTKMYSGETIKTQVQAKIEVKGTN